MRGFLIVSLLICISSIVSSFHSHSLVAKSESQISHSTSFIGGRVCTEIKRPFVRFFSSNSNNNDNIKSSLKTKTTSNITTYKKVSEVERFSRLPVWPVWNGILIFIIGKIFGSELAAKAEDVFGGRVCPNFFIGEKTSPFLLLVHHTHSFAYGDLLRYFQKTFFPEGFPAHPHRGFITVTYILKGGMIHRDSLGVKEVYGAEDRHKGKHTQWMITGSGMLHEEMWDIPSFSLQSLLQPPSKQELYQLWLNLPSNEKLCKPKSILLGGEDETPTAVYNNTKTIVICGTYRGKKASIQTASSVDIFHVSIDSPSSQWIHTVPSSHKTIILYMRKGSVMIADTLVHTHCTAYVTASGDDLVVSNIGKHADFLFLSGQPLNEPIASQGSMVMNYQNEIDEAYQDYQMAKMGAPWKHTLTDEEWREHVRKYPSLYR